MLELTNPAASLEALIPKIHCQSFQEPSGRRTSAFFICGVATATQFQTGNDVNPRFLNQGSVPFNYSDWPRAYRAVASSVPKKHYRCREFVCSRDGIAENFSGSPASRKAVPNAQERSAWSAGRSPVSPALLLALERDLNAITKISSRRHRAVRNYCEMARPAFLKGCDAIDTGPDAGS